MRVSFHPGGLLLMALTICPGKDGGVEQLIVQSQDKACYLLGFKPEISAQTYGWVAFRLG